MAEFKEPTGETPPPQNPFKTLFDACLASGENPNAYAQRHGINLESEEFFQLLSEWSAATKTTRSFEEEVLLYRIAAQVKACCHHDCNGPTCTNGILKRLVEQNGLSVEQNLKLISAVLHATKKPAAFRANTASKILHKLLQNKLSLEEGKKVRGILDECKRFIVVIVGKSNLDTYTETGLEEFGKVIDQCEQKLAE